ncbi:MAG: hypothetical protein ACPL7D_10000 [Candidatus Sumerlaeaceae bacterium]|jgi:hypothetical protein
MIKINLLPREAGKKAPGSAAGPKGLAVNPMFVFSAILVLLYVVGAFAFFWAYSESAKANRAFQEVKNRKEKKQKEVDRRKKELLEKSAELEDIERRYEVARALSPENRIYWSEKLNMLALARRDLAVYVTKINLSEKVDEVETPESVKKRQEHRDKKLPGPEPAPVKRPIINQSLTIEAIAYGRDAQEKLNNVVAFQNALKNLKWRRENATIVRFLDGLNPEFSQLPQKVAIVGGIEVMRFGFVVNAEPQTSRQPAATNAPASGGTKK